MIHRQPLLTLILIIGVVTACLSPQTEPEIRLVLTGQALIKKDPRIRWNDPFGTLRQLLECDDVVFTNFEMAVMPEVGRCDVPADVDTI